MQVKLRILRYDPQRDDKPHWESYLVEAGPMDRVTRMRYNKISFHKQCVWS